jgi:hypothetical protein
VGGFSGAPGTDLWLRGDDITHNRNNHGLTIDELTSVAEVPEPSAFALHALRGAILLAIRRRQAIP